ncbi:MAG: putative membrane protein [Marinobacter maritimus]|mgnify:CR=1 FL=1|jgi:putative membrane protein|uniref:cytochrome c oxidase assembly protein n=1 Tax=Marinobacter maritimus TaxID=277961 RepID=UPI000BD65436|nr:cytochrome c oxidase assembly protein [Marinobacter maritimus]MBL1272134.1 cytochrome c oxidase assembly protein [Oceanospirillales bacterium]|tara:strand:+ start:1244 stop:2053 length:810 start_codon:yes stop_codon:yes gene_type:complete
MYLNWRCGSWLGLALLGLSTPAFGHSPITSEGAEQLTAMIGLIIFSAVWLAYLIGARRVAPNWSQAFGFHSTMVISFLALWGPLDHWAESSAAAHMVQHMMFMVVIAPLWVLTRPLPQLAAGSGRLLTRLWQPTLKLVQHPVYMAYLHAVMIWFWHIPQFYVLALKNPWWHLIEHGCFLVTAGLFWWSVLKSPQRTVGWALFAVLFTLMHTGFLGAMLTFAQSPLYGAGRSLQDQQLAGLIMWVLGAIPYLLGSGWIGSRMYRQLQHRV